MEIPSDWDSRPPPKMAGRRFAIFREDRKSFQKFILSDQMRDPVAQVAQAMLADAKASTPRSKGKRRRKGERHVQDSYTLRKKAGTLVVGDSFPYARVKVEVRNNHRRAAALEFGNAKTKKYRMLGKAGAKFGDFKGKSKP